MHGKAEIRLGLDRHGGDAEKPTAPGRAVVMMGFGRLLGHASTVVVAHRSVGVEMSRDVHLGCVVPMNMGWPVDRQAVREPAAAKRKRGRRHEETHGVEQDDEARRRSSRPIGQPGKHHSEANSEWEPDACRIVELYIWSDGRRKTPPSTLPSLPPISQQNTQAA